MTSDTLLRQAVRGALALGAAGTLAGAGMALAQTPAAAGGTAAQATKLSKIIVVGSRIPRTSIATSQPVITINRQQIQATGFTTVGQLLQNMTSAGASLNVNFNNGGNGAQTINLHNLGSSRTLVLVNGHRWPTALAGYVDLTTIPTSAVQRVEVLLDGASAVYGSDAISGVINIITVKNYNGAEANAYFGLYDAHGDGGGWDGKTQRYSFTVGTSNDRSAVLLSAGYYKSNPVWAGQRTISFYPLIGFGNTLGSSGTPGGRFLVVNWATGNPYSNIPGCGPTGYFGYPGCNVAGPLTGPNANSHPFTNADRYNYAPANYFKTPQERWYTYTQGHYDLTSNITFDFTTMYQRRNSAQILAPNPWFFGLFGGTQANGINIGISAANPYNPFGTDLVPYYSSSPGWASWCKTYGSNNGSCTANAASLTLLGRRPLEAGNRVFSQNQNTLYINSGFTGYFQLFGNQWTWDTHYGYSQVLNTTITQGLANTLNIQEALGPNCSNIPGCVPLNLFGGDINGQGTITPAMLKWVMFTAHAVTKQVMRNYTGNLAGNFFNGWYAGPWGLAAGYEYLEFDGFNQPDALVSEGNTVGNVTQPTAGRQNSNAQYVELSVPLAQDLPFAKSVSLDIANRWSQFKWDGSTGPFQPGVSDGAHASTGRVGIKWQPINTLLLRGTWSQGFRVPSLSDLFFGQSDSYPDLTDPCVANPTLPNCPANAVQPNNQIRITVGGNPYLTPEKAISRQVGFVWSPDFVPGLDVSADYYKVELTNAVGTIGAQTIINGCYNSNLQNYCALITRSGGAITNVLNTNVNTGSLQVNGWDLNLRYLLPATSFGQFRVNLTANFLKMLKSCNVVSTTSGLQGQCAEFAGSATGGFTPYPKRRFNLGVDWSYGNWAAAWNVYLIGKTYEVCANSTAVSVGGSPLTAGWCSDPTAVAAGSTTPTGLNEIGTTIYHDVQVSYTEPAWNTTFTFGIQNLLNKEPPIAMTAFANSTLPIYRIPGRFVYARVGVKF